MKRPIFLPAVLLVAVLGTALSSCRKQSAAVKPQVLDPSIDGVAVRPLEPFDLQLARRILRGETDVPLIEKQSEAPSPVAAAPAGPSAGTVTAPSAPSAAPSASTSPYGGSGDANDIF